MATFAPYGQVYDKTFMYYNSSKIEHERALVVIDDLQHLHDDSVIGIINTVPDFSTFKKILHKSKLYHLLTGEDCTVFIPSDEQMAMMSISIDVTDKVLCCNIVRFSTCKKSLDRALLQYSSIITLPTRHRESLLVHTKKKLSSQALMDTMIGPSTVIHWNQPAKNGIIHVIDMPLVPFH